MRGPETWGAMFRHQVERCWRKPARDGSDAANTKVEIMIDLTREGKLDGQPVLGAGSTPATTDFARAYQASALRAITECQPYTLPVEYYDQWKKFTSVFLETPLGQTGKPAGGELDKRKLSICRGC
ncbi:cell envelope integrity protein TolA [Bradyrhizobium sp. Pear77]|uniref:cell envelope integrity protein TolA n=1 Tax=Bradyrhizobium altum TaxID=1571202 RepID=UPI001E542CE3|nr:cell envelope integrity protein TolA [Bradyrhizobium altum]MCC8958481.1 cell envelope integrity protein TolA [Bradyrhizobium altum]